MVALLALAGLSACGSSSSSSSGNGAPAAATPPQTRPHITIDAKDSGYTLPAEIPAGWVDVTLHNSGTVGHQIAFAKLNSVSFAAFMAAAAATNVKALSGVDFVGGPNNVDPGKAVTATIHLETGQYAVACFIPDNNDRRAHAAHGMIGEVNVVQTADSVDDPPKVDAGTVSLSEFTFLPDAGFTGNGTVAIKNVGSQIHELTIEKVLAGKTFADVKRYLLPPPGSAPASGPPPIADAGGIVGLGPDRTMYQTLVLTPGKYVFVCFFPDPAKGDISHAAEGMLKEITIS
jgi:hypothetical protein